jgi:hypothetical protein
MSEPIKDNEQIRADPEAFLAAFERARAQLGRIPGVVGVAHGLKETAGRFGDQSAIVVFVTKKRPEGEIAAEQRIPSTFEGYRTDVRVMGSIENLGVVCRDDAWHATITGGIQIKAVGSNPPAGPMGAGTLGCIARKRGDSGGDNVYLLTCEHCLLEADLHTTDGDGVYHPSSPKTTPVSRKGTLLGKIDRRLARKCHVDDKGVPWFPEPDAGPPNPDITAIDTTFAGFYVDCAAVRLDLGSFCCGSACTRNDVQYAPTIPALNTPLQPGIDPADIDKIKDIRDLRKEPPLSLHGLRVVKNGRTTARTVGRITAAPAPAHDIVLEHVTVFRYNVIEIELDPSLLGINPCTGTNAFAAPGDSGSIVVDEQNRAVGLLFGNGKPDDAGKILTYACFIVPVLDALGMCIPTTSGSSHGSSKATDGSGLAQYGGNADPQQDDDRVLFSDQGVHGAPVPAKPALLAAPATDEQRARMQPLLDALLETERGRELREDFSQLSREIAYLVRRRRPVTVTWHRHRGPAYLACALDHLKGDDAAVPQQIDGVTRSAMLTAMGRVLAAHGSNPLRAAIQRHRDLLLSCADAATAEECIERIRSAATTRAPE